MRYHPNKLMPVVFVMLAVGITACKDNRKPVVDRLGMEKFIRDADNGLIQKSEVNGVTVTVAYFPSSLLAATDLNEKENITDSAIQQAEHKYDDQYYFKLRFSKNGGEAIRQMGGFSEYSNLVQVLAFRMGQYINATTPQKDTVEMADYFFDQTYGMSDANSLLLAFPKKRFDHTGTLYINLAECGFNTGSLQFKFDKKDIEKVPSLDYHAAPES